MERWRHGTHSVVPEACADLSVDRKSGLGIESGPSSSLVYDCEKDLRKEAISAAESLADRAAGAAAAEAAVEVGGAAGPRERARASSRRMHDASAHKRAEASAGSRPRTDTMNVSAAAGGWSGTAKMRDPSVRKLASRRDSNTAGGAPQA